MELVALLMFYNNNYYKCIYNYIYIIINMYVRTRIYSYNYMAIIIIREYNVIRLILCSSLIDTLVLTYINYGISTKFCCTQTACGNKN